MNGMAFAAIDMVINSVKLEQIVPRLTALLSRGAIHVMIHEQYFMKITVHTSRILKKS